MLKCPHDEAGLLRNRFYFCRCVVAVNAKVIYCFEVIFLKSFFQRVRSAWFCNPRLVFTPTEKIRGKGNFDDVSNEYKVIVFREEFPGFLMVNVHNSKTRTLQNKDSTLQKIVQHIYFVLPLLRGGQIGAQLPWRHSLKLDSRLRYVYERNCYYLLDLKTALLRFNC